MSEQSSLEDLLVDEEQLNKELLANTVGEYVNIGQDSGDLLAKESYNQLTSSKKVIVTLLAQKARFELDIAEQEWITPSKLSKLSGVKKGTVYPTVRDLADEGIVRSDDGEYVIPAVKIEEAKEYLAGD
jgi:ribosomal protein S25